MGRDGKDQCLTRMCVQRSKIWSRCVRRDSKRQTKCLICRAREAEEVEPGEAVVAEGNLVVEVEGILVVAAIEVGEVAGGISVVVVVVVALVREEEEEEEEVEVNVGEEDSHEEDSVDDLRLVKTFELRQLYLSK